MRRNLWWDVYLGGMVTVIAGVLLVCVSGTAVSAATTSTFKISPVRTDVTIQPGETSSLQVLVTNLTESAISVRPTVNDFVAGDEDGTPALILDESTSAPSRSLKRFIKPLEDSIIPPKQTKPFEVVIAVPKDTQAGGYFGAIRISPADVSSGGQVNVTASVAALILLTVPGDAVERLELTDFMVQQGGAVRSFFHTGDTIAGFVRFRNEGNTQLGPFGKVSVKKGDRVVYEVDFNNKDPRDMVLPSSARRWNVPLEEVHSFGYYTVLATFTYGQKNQTIEVVKSFWVVPVHVMLGVAIGFVVLCGLILGVFLYVRRAKQRRRVSRHLSRHTHRRHR